ncbi:hypothetical protein MASR2M78_17570 [Treponema sp.]
MKKYAYPASFMPARKHSYTIEFPDFPYCSSFGKDLEEAKLMAEEALSLNLFCMLEAKEKLPRPTPLKHLEVGKGAIVAMVECCPELCRDRVERIVV